MIVRGEGTNSVRANINANKVIANVSGDVNLVVVQDAS